MHKLQADLQGPKEVISTCEFLEFKHLLRKVAWAAASFAGGADLEGGPHDINGGTGVLSLGKEPVTHANEPCEVILPVLICSTYEE